MLKIGIGCEQSNCGGLNMTGLYIVELALQQKDKTLLESMQGKFEAIAKKYQRVDSTQKFVRDGNKRLCLAFECTDEEADEITYNYVMAATIYLLMFYGEKLKLSFAFIKGEEVCKDFLAHMDFDKSVYIRVFRTTIECVGGQDVALTGFAHDQFWETFEVMVPKLNQVLALLSVSKKAKEEIDIFTLVEEINKKEAQEVNL